MFCGPPRQLLRGTLEHLCAHVEEEAVDDAELNLRHRDQRGPDQRHQRQIEAPAVVVGVGAVADAEQSAGKDAGVRDEAPPVACPVVRELERLDHEAFCRHHERLAAQVLDVQCALHDGNALADRSIAHVAQAVIVRVSDRHRDVGLRKMRSVIGRCCQVASRRVGKLETERERAYIQTSIESDQRVAVILHVEHRLAIHDGCLAQRFEGIFLPAQGAIGLWRQIDRRHLLECRASAECDLEAAAAHVQARLRLRRREIRCRSEEADGRLRGLGLKAWVDQLVVLERLVGAARSEHARDVAIAIGPRQMGREPRQIDDLQRGPAPEVPVDADGRLRRACRLRA